LRAAGAAAAFLLDFAATFASALGTAATGTFAVAFVGFAVFLSDFAIEGGEGEGKRGRQVVEEAAAQNFWPEKIRPQSLCFFVTFSADGAYQFAFDPLNNVLRLV
jgi:hypothetical protein